MGEDKCLKIMAWVGSEVLPHEASVRAWLKRWVNASDVEDIIQESYCRISALEDVAHIQNGRAYLFKTARMLVYERLRRLRVVSIETVAEIDALSTSYDEPSPERVAAGRRELARVKKLIEDLPERCRKVFSMRKIDGMSQSEVASALNLPEYTIENDVKKGLKLILNAIAEGEQRAERAFVDVGKDERTRDSSIHK